MKHVVISYPTNYFMCPACAKSFRDRWNLGISPETSAVIRCPVCDAAINAEWDENIETSRDDSWSGWVLAEVPF